MTFLAEQDDADVRDLLDLVVADGGALVALASIYVDESGTHEDSPVTTIGGVIFKKRNAIEFSRKWSAFLRAKGVPYFHMTEVTHPKDTLYNEWKPEELIAFEKQLIKTIGMYAEAGFAYSLSEKDHVAHFTEAMAGWNPVQQVGAPYSYLLRYSLAYSTHWAKESKFDGRLAYFFEAGHRHQSQANRIISTILRPPQSVMRKRPVMHALNVEERSRYLSHTFVDKRDAPPLQAADLIAWLWRNTVLKTKEGKPERKDWTALRRAIPITTRHIEPEFMEFQRGWMEDALRLFGLARD